MKMTDLLRRLKVDPSTAGTDMRNADERGPGEDKFRCKEEQEELECV